MLNLEDNTALRLTPPSLAQRRPPWNRIKPRPVDPLPSIRFVSRCAAEKRRAADRIGSGAPRWMDNRSQCNQASPTPVGRRLIIGFTWRVVILIIGTDTTVLPPVLLPPLTAVSGPSPPRQRHAECMLPQ